MFDLKIVGGTVVDGTGAPRFTADVAVSGGKIVEVRRRSPSDPPLDGAAAETIDATGKIVAPGFVDIHTHYDGQVSWDDVLEPSSNQGVTTVISGNCGVGFAPVRPGSEQWLIELMEGVEDIPGTALSEGITWGWESYAEYLDVISRRELAVDYGSQIAHGTVRAYAMGERGARNEPATAEDIALMSRIVQEAVEAGALGFSTSRTEAHRAKRWRTGRWTVSRCREPSPPRMSCSRSVGRSPQAVARCSSWRPRGLRARTSLRRRSNWSGCAGSGRRSTAR